MVKFYVNRIKQGKMTIDEVPGRWKEAVEKVLEKNEYLREPKSRM